ncbi:hypothetical protein EJ02DRAFT_308660, partial [Clathrospora elynae]
VADTPTKGGGARSGWSDRELLAYLFGLVEYSKAKLDVKNAPRPAGRTVRACEHKIQSLKSSFRAELDALHTGDPIIGGDAMTTPKKGGRKRKGDDKSDTDASPRKRNARKKKSEAEVELIEEEFEVKSEVKAE